MELNIKTLVDRKLTPNAYVYLYYLVNKMICPIPLPDTNLTMLESKGYIKIMADGKIIARTKAIELVDTEGQYEYKEPTFRVEEWIEEWRNLFPAGIKSGGHYVKGSPSGCLKKMKAFVKDHPKITKTVIFEATKRYVEEYRLKRFAYMKIADYFINKDGTSMLEAYIEQYKNSPEFEVATNNMTDDI